MQILTRVSAGLRELTVANGEPIVLLDERGWDAIKHHWTEIPTREAVDAFAKGDILWAGVRYMLKSTYDRKINQ